MAVPARPFLVFSSVGPHSCHLQWLRGRANFDLALVDYAGGCPSSPEYFLWRHPGTKWPNLAWLARHWPQLEQYRMVAVLDDDLQIEGEALDTAFQLCQQHGLWLAQPSLRLGSAFSWTFTLQRPYLRLRYTGFVENGLTILRLADLPPLLPLLEEAGSGYGLDWILPHLLQAPPRTIAVLDEVCAFHPGRAPALDQVWTRAEQAEQGLALCRKYAAPMLAPREDGYLLNARGQAWVEEGASPALVYASAHRFVLHQMAAVIQRFQPAPGIES